jgi:HlyD family secretion protein
MKLSKRILGILTLVIILSALTVGIYLRTRTGGESDSEAATAEAGDAMAALPASASQQFATDVPQPVEGAVVVRDTLWITVTADGQAESIRRTALMAQVSGVLRQVLVRENDAVDTGDLLLQIDTTEYSLALARARAGMVAAQASYQEMVLFDDQITDPQVREERDRLARARSGLTQAEVALREAEINLERTSVRAPFPGRVANLMVVEGEPITSGKELLSVVGLNPIKVEVQVLEREIRYLQEGRRATITFTAFPGETFSGRVSSINPVVNPEFRTGRVTILLDNRAGRVKPGMYARVSLEAEYFPNRILVPRSAILEKDRRTMLFVFEDGRAKWRYVTTGLYNDTQVEILENPDTEMVEPGEIVLVDNHFYIQHDAAVQLTNELPGAGNGGDR